MVFQIDLVALKGTWAQNFAFVFMAYICLEKEPSTKFSCVLVNFRKIMKFQSFEFGVSDVIPTDIQNISLLLFFNFIEKKPSVKFPVFLAIFHELMKLQNFEWLNCVST